MITHLCWYTNAELIKQMFVIWLPVWTCIHLLRCSEVLPSKTLKCIFWKPFQIEVWPNLPSFPCHIVAFRIYDMDKDGYISNGELFQVLKMMVGNNLKDTQLQQIVDKTIINADKDGDGRISFEEFCAVSRRNKGLLCGRVADFLKRSIKWSQVFEKSHLEDFWNQ